MSPEGQRPAILLTGATGCIGGRLLAVLEARGHRVRCLTRRPAAMAERLGSHTGVVRGDCLDPASLQGAFAGIATAYYLVHSMGNAADFEAQDRAAARNFGAAARAAGVRRIVYMGGLGASAALSRHLRSRHETGNVLRESGVPVVEFRSAVVIGAGSLSFELIRALVERLPVMVCPAWVRTPTQPIALADVVAYLAAALYLPHGGSHVFEVGGADVVSYGGIMQEYSRQRGLRRRLIPVPLLTPRLSSLWLGLTTPVYARVGRELIDGLRTATVVNDAAARTAFRVRPRGLRQAIAGALEEEDAAFADGPWSEAALRAGAALRWGGVRIRTRLVHSCTVDVLVPPAAAFAPIRRIGGDNGWYYGNWIWRLRGLADRLLGGVGMHRGRRDPERLAVGDILDCWRVEAYESDVRLRLAAEMKVPGRAWLQFDVTRRDDGTCTVRQTAVFDARGLWGRFYWHALYPVHVLLFKGLLRSIAGRAMREASSDGIRSAV
ncbi:MAG: SDR family oxidoreductase [Acidobacteria bacterium]|nr:SDR family oxidoreductase [Acidobacteriota bacterium]